MRSDVQIAGKRISKSAARLKESKRCALTGIANCGKRRSMDTAENANVAAKIGMSSWH
jgi:hypothetical protein